ncbi:hypothetical protein C5H24_12825, partial [Xylella fastidiosa]
LLSKSTRHGKFSNQLTIHTHTLHLHIEEQEISLPQVWKLETQLKIKTLVFTLSSKPKTHLLERIEHHPSFLTRRGGDFVKGL